MRNPFHQFADAVATELDTFNYFSLARAADLCPKGGRVLDLCCGRGLLLPFLRYRDRQCSAYVGVDLEPKNAIWKDGRDPRRRGKDNLIKGWEFTRIFVQGSVGSGMSSRVLAAIKDEKAFSSGLSFELIAFTSSIEHMQPEAQREALVEAATLVNLKGRMYLTCPVTPEEQDGYDCQYAAHVYEPKDAELKLWLATAGWKVVEEIGLVTKVTHLKKVLRDEDLERAQEFLKMGPRQLMLPLLATLFPQAATEKAYICQLKDEKTSGPNLRSSSPE